MSVTFSPELGPITGYAFACGHEEGVTAHRFGTYQDAEAFRRAEHDANGGTGHLAICGDECCAVSPMFIATLEEDPAPEVNVSCAHAWHLPGLLGYDTGEHEGSGIAGSDTAEGFLGRILVALAVNPVDAGVPATASHGGRFVDCGRRPGYCGELLERLRGIADFAVAHGRPIRWG